MIKKYNKALFREKFQRYRVFFLVCTLLFVLALVLEWALFGSGGFTVFGGKVSFEVFFIRLAMGEMLLYLIIFFLGLTIYAPFFAFFSSFLRGALSGFCLSSAFSGMESRGTVLLFLFTLFYILASSQLFMGYASFSANCALQLYSASEIQNNKKAESKMFGGTLFRSTLFCGTVNLRFLFSYSLVFLLSLFLSALLAAFYAFLRSLI